MSDRQPVCPKCQSAMEVGWLPDLSMGGSVMPRWQSGIPEPNGVLGLGGLKLNADRPYVATYRCPNCGYLESYAR